MCWDFKVQLALQLLKSVLTEATVDSEADPISVMTVSRSKTWLVVPLSAHLSEQLSVALKRTFATLCQKVSHFIVFFNVKEIWSALNL
jgi:hypothetical protein